MKKETELRHQVTSSIDINVEKHGFETTHNNIKNNSFINNQVKQLMIDYLYNKY